MFVEISDKKLLCAGSRIRGLIIPKKILPFNRYKRIYSLF